MAGKRSKFNEGVSFSATPRTQVMAIVLAVTLATLFVLAINAMMY